MASMAVVTRRAMGTDTTTATEARPIGDALARLRLLQLVSPTLPIGGFTCSQGLEYAVEAGWVGDMEDLNDWLVGLAEDNLAHLEVPLLARLYRACQRGDVAALGRWGDYLLATRETRELRQEEQRRAAALTRLLMDLGIPRAIPWRRALETCQTAPYALAAAHWKIPLTDAALGYAWSWLENRMAAAIKLIPLGQTDGQRLLLRLAERLPAVLETGLALPDDRIGASSPLAALASSLHETQYTRLFRN